ncbi:MAG TPA: reverse transcriptase family protein, partial [Agitococcus sp.]|nr:reverse transcriptase family protein [Agitococcus sp.]
TKLNQGRAPDLDGITAEHLYYSHPITTCILAKLFNLMMFCSYVPPGFCHSYTVPLPKLKDCRTKAMSCDDFRGIAISSLLSKVFEHCILDRFTSLLDSSDNQFGFKEKLGCNHVIYTVHNIVDRFVNCGNTINLCAIDLSKAFDKVNHHGLLLKLMKRHVPNNLIDLLDFWLSNIQSCIKWCDVFSEFFKINYGVRQGSILSPFLFAVYLNDIVDHRRNGVCNFVLLYADDILLLASSLTELQKMFSACERELQLLDMAINVKKSCCMRIGPRFDVFCTNIITFAGNALPWVNTLRYLGVYLISSRSFKCSLDNAKRSFYKSLNAIFGKVGRLASEEVVLQLVAKICMPILMYGTEACKLNKSDVRSLDFMVTRFLMRLFKTNNLAMIQDCTWYFKFKLPSVLLKERVDRFLCNYDASSNCFCQLFGRPSWLAHV